jgi:predicted kinase
MKTLYIIRGLSGSGKTTLAHELSPVVYSADDWFTDGDGVYEFDPAELSNAHAECFSSVEFDMESEVPIIAVANTFSQKWETEPYFKVAKKYGYSPFVIECQNTFENVHEVPQETINAMKNRWESLV